MSGGAAGKEYPLTLDGKLDLLIPSFYDSSFLQCCCSKRPDPGFFSWLKIDRNQFSQKKGGLS
jgi:hypothetical protein